MAGIFRAARIQHEPKYDLAIALIPACTASRAVEENELSIRAREFTMACGDFFGRAHRAVEIFWFCGALTQHDALLTMNGEPRQEKRSWKKTLLMVLRRLAFLIALGFAIGWILNHAEA